MARKSSERLRTLLKLAEMREQAAARQLGQGNERLQQAQLQSHQLHRYESDYQQRYVDLGGSALSSNALRNFQGFFRQLETAQIRQEQTVELRAKECEKARQCWLEQHARRRLLDRVRDQRLASEALAAEKKAQRDLDDRPPRASVFASPDFK